ncbi:MAG: hypothetical protein ACODAF_05400 [Actinomycetota bacterium]
MGDRLVSWAERVAPVVRAAAARLDGWDWVTVYATVVLLAGCWIAFGLGVALIVHGVLWLALAVAGARGAESSQPGPEGG